MEDVAAEDAAAEEVPAAEEAPAVEDVPALPLHAAIVSAIAKTIIAAITFFILSFPFTFNF